MKVWIMLCWLLVTAGYGYAAVVDVRSGEHQTFTRLVLTLPFKAEGWVLKGSGELYQLRLPKKSSAYSIATVFDRIPKTRLLNIDAQPDSDILRLKLGCECDVTVFAFGDRRLVIDIADAAPKIEPSLYTNLPFVFGNPALQSNEPFQLRGIHIPQAEHPVSTIERSAIGLLNVQSSITRDQRTKETREQLVKELARSASRGLLIPELTEIKARPAPTFQPEPKKVQVLTSISQDTGEDYDQRGQMNFRTMNAVDSASFGHTEELLEGRQLACKKRDALEIQNWSNGKGIGNQVGEWRRRLFGEFDRANEDAVLGLAQVYLHFTFGAEARKILMLASESKPRLSAISRILDGTPLIKNNPFLGMQECDSIVAFWAVVSGGVTSVPSDEATQVILRHFYAFPAHLKQQLGPALSQEFLALGNKGVATKILEVVDRTGDKFDPYVQLMQAKLSIDGGDSERAIDNYEAVVVSNTDVSPLALVEMIDAAINANLSLNPSTAELAGAYAVEYRDHVLGPKLRQAHVLARMQAQQFDVAYQQIQDIRQRDGEDIAKDLFGKLSSALVEYADDFEFLSLTLSQNLYENLVANPAASNMVSKRLLTLGFPELARAALPKSAVGDDLRQQRLLRAQSSLAERRPRQAEADLLGLAGEDVTLLRAQAKEMRGDYDGARKIYEKLKHEASVQSMAWLSENWSKLGSDRDALDYNSAQAFLEEESRQNSEIVNGGQNLTLKAQSSLSNLSDMVNRSQEIRGVLTAMLERHQVSER